MRSEAVVALVDRRDDDRDHLPLQFRESGIAEHQIVVHAGEGTQLPSKAYARRTFGTMPSFFADREVLGGLAEFLRGQIQGGDQLRHLNDSVQLGGLPIKTANRTQTGSAARPSPSRIYRFRSTLQRVEGGKVDDDASCVLRAITTTAGRTAETKTNAGDVAIRTRRCRRDERRNRRPEMVIVEAVGATWPPHPDLSTRVAR